MRFLQGGMAAIVFLAATVTGAQVPAPAGQAPATETISAHPQLDAYKNHRAATLINDYGELARYRAANAALVAPKAGEQRVIFFGDSITDGWKLDTNFPGKGYINRGISGQTTSQMLVRFRQDVLDLQPHVLLMLAGTNDLAGNTGPISLEDIERNYASMAELARAHHIVMVFSSVMPVNGDHPDKREFFETRSSAQIAALNTWLRQYCATNGDIYLDYYGAMVDGRGQMQPALSNDGLHPNDAGYKVIAPLAQQAIEQAMKM